MSSCDSFSCSAVQLVLDQMYVSVGMLSCDVFTFLARTLRRHAPLADTFYHRLLGKSHRWFRR